MRNPPTQPSVPSHVTPEAPRELEVRRAGIMVGRALLRRCPNCGHGKLFSRWIVMRRSCPGCHLRLDRGESDYFIGGFVVNFVAAELLLCVAGLAGILLTWPDVPWTLLKWSLVALIIPIPFLFLPWARTLWLAVDLTFRPVTLKDLEGHGENLPTRPTLHPVGGADRHPVGGASEAHPG
jgi:uncharacterized protein (DUF983 family)